MSRIAVVGGGLFGVTAAVVLARDGHQVDLYERHSDLLMEASFINQYCLHRGYHYPRSLETAAEVKRGLPSFHSEYGRAVIRNHLVYYVISTRDSLTSADNYLDFCHQAGLGYIEAWPEVIKREAVQLSVIVPEHRIEPYMLRSLCWQKIHRFYVKVHLCTKANPHMLAEYDFVIIATYSRLNELVSAFWNQLQKYQFEVVEKPVVRLPKAYEWKSIEVGDGPFMCVGPVGRTGLFVMGNVVHAIHHTNTDFEPEVPDKIAPLLNQGIIRNPPVTKFPLFVQSAREFFKGIEEAEHIGSMYTIRTVLPNVEDTDARPTIVKRITDRVITVYSGKIPTCVEAARQVSSMIKES